MRTVPSPAARGRYAVPVWNNGAVLTASESMSAPTRGAITAAVAAALALGAYFGETVMAVVVVVSALIFAWGFPGMLRNASPRGSTAVIALTLLTGVGLSFAFPDDENVLTLTIAFGVVAAFLHQMLRRDGRPRMVESVSVTVSGLIIAVSAIGWIDALVYTGGVALALVTAAALAFAAGVTFLPVRGHFVTLIAVVGATALGAILSGIVPGVHPVAASVLSFAAGSMVAAVHILFIRYRAISRPWVAFSAATISALSMGLPVMQVAAFTG